MTVVATAQRVNAERLTDIFAMIPPEKQSIVAGNILAFIAGMSAQEALQRSQYDRRRD